MRTPVKLAFVSLITVFAVVVLSQLIPRPAFAADAPKVVPVAVLGFQERGTGVKGYGEKVSELLFASLATSPEIVLVDRADIKKVLEELEVNLTGMVATDQATKVGHLTGAKILITGSALEVDKLLYLVAKIIGTETSRVRGESVKGKTTDDLGTLVEELAKKVQASVVQHADELVAKGETPADRIKVLKEKLGDARRPVVVIQVAERHVGQATIDPAAETELTLCCRETGFQVIDAKSGSAKSADVVISGEGFSEFATRQGNLVSVKARLEVKAVDRATDKVLTADRQVAVVVDLTEQVAGKNALQQASREIAQRLLPLVVQQWNKAHGKK